MQQCLAPGSQFGSQGKESLLSHMFWMCSGGWRLSGWEWETSECRKRKTHDSVDINQLVKEIFQKEMEFIT